MYLKITKWILIIAAMVIVYYIGGIICLFLLFISHIVTPVANYFHNHTGNVPRFKFIFFDMLNFLEQNLVYFEKKRYIKFEIWLDSLLCQDMSSDIIAYYFCLYEGSYGCETITFHLIGSDEFDEIDEDWACNNLFDDNPLFYNIVRTPDIQDWRDAEKMSIAIIDKYLQNGKYAYKLKEVTAVGVGFDDGSITILHRKETLS